MVELHPEWQEALGVRDATLARTWARLEIRVTDSPAASRWLTKCVDLKADSLRRGVYGSVFSLAEWIVENWWFLLFEPVRAAQYGGGRDLGGRTELRPWIQRHNLLAAREGGSLPDLTFYSDDNEVVACWFPDPEQEEQSRPVRFISGAGEARLRRADVEQSFHQFVEMVLKRLDQEEDEDSRRLRRNWQAVCESRTSEADLCAWAANLGLDPYDPAQLGDELIDRLEGDVKRLPTSLRTDLLDASAGASLQSDLNWLKTASERLNLLLEQQIPDAQPNQVDRAGTIPYLVGYQNAREFRRSFDIAINPIPNLAQLLHQKCSWPVDPEIFIDKSQNPGLTALVGKDSKGDPRIVEERGRPESLQYRLARALYFVPDDKAKLTPRLITKAHTWDQRASRAFAAELLAPADALQQRVNDITSLDDVQRVAGEFYVSSWVIEHQLVNHGLARIEGDLVYPTLEAA